MPLFTCKTLAVESVEMLIQRVLLIWHIEWCIDKKFNLKQVQGSFVGSTRLVVWLMLHARDIEMNTTERKGERYDIFREYSPLSKKTPLNNQMVLPKSQLTSWVSFDSFRSIMCHLCECHLTLYGVTSSLRSHLTPLVGPLAILDRWLTWYP